MSFADIIWMVVILSGAVYLLYRAVWKKKGYCQGCDSGMCHKKD
ncbi:MAG: FeoB-associated Cys-rich membrane protein [Nitrospirota bacterium]